VELRALYSGATFFVYPSLIEGFGLPILEAMSAGCPVLTSNTSSMPEVAGDAARYVDPVNVESIAEGMVELASDAALRARLIKSGYQRLPLFTWEKTAMEMINVYERALEISVANRGR
jgi:glycosyltransferase involved in cell wall biosynthesis